MTDKQQIILAALTTTGPRTFVEDVNDDGEYAERLENDGEWNERFMDNVKIAYSLLDENSAASRLLDNLDNATKFVANIVGGRLEKTSKRIVVELESKPSKSNPDGIEKIRTERTDTPAGQAMKNKLKSLVGHRVLVYKHLEQNTRDGQTEKYRTLIHVEDLGKARPFD